MRRVALALLLFLLLYPALGAAQALGRRSVVLHNAVDPTAVEAFSATINVDAASEYRLVQIRVATLTSASVILRTYCRVANASTWVTAATTTLTAAGDAMVNLVERCLEVQTGLQTTGDAAGDSVTVRLDFK